MKKKKKKKKKKTRFPHTFYNIFGRKTVSLTPLVQNISKNILKFFKTNIFV